MTVAEREVAVLGLFPYYDAIAHRICLSVGRIDLVDDVTQESRLALWEFSGVYDECRNSNFKLAANDRVVGAMMELLRHSGKFKRYLSIRQVQYVDALPRCSAPNQHDPLLSGWSDKLRGNLAYVVAQVYWHGLSQREIGRKMGFTEGRVSQLHTEAMRKLRKFFKVEAA